MKKFLVISQENPKLETVQKEFFWTIVFKTTFWNKLLKIFCKKMTKKKWV